MIVSRDWQPRESKTETLISRHAPHMNVGFEVDAFIDHYLNNRFPFNSPEHVEAKFREWIRRNVREGVHTRHGGSTDQYADVPRLGEPL